MKTFFLNESGDLELDGSRNIRMVEGPAEKAQTVRLLISTFAGEWFLNTRHGVDHWAYLGQKWPAAEERARAALYEALEQEPRIEEILELGFEFDRQQRKLKVYFKLRIEGEEVEDEAEVTV